MRVEFSRSTITTKTGGASGAPRRETHSVKKKNKASFGEIRLARVRYYSATFLDHCIVYCLFITLQHSFITLKVN